MSSIFSQTPPALTVDPVALVPSPRLRYRLDNVRGLATLLLTTPSRRLARWAWRSAQGGSQALGEARAEVRLWQAARADHRATAELVQSSQRDLREEPFGPAWGRFPERLADGRGTASHLRHP